MYSDSYYPSLMAGSGYIMSMDAVQCLYDAAKRIPYLHMEDVFITGFAAEACNVSRTHLDGYQQIDTKNEFNFDVSILKHLQKNPDKMEALFANMP